MGELYDGNVAFNNGRLVAMPADISTHKHLDQNDLNGLPTLVWVDDEPGDIESLAGHFEYEGN